LKQFDVQQPQPSEQAKPKETKYEELTLQNDFMFCKVMTAYPELCREVAEVLIGESVGDLEFIDSHFSVKESVDGKGVVFDVIAKDSDTCYNIEMQVGQEAALGKRIRYYRGMTDAALLQQGQGYEELYKAFVIFICAYDPFGAKLPKYTFRQTCEQVPEVKLGDEATVIIINLASEQLVGTEERFRNLVNYLAGNGPADDLEQRLEEAVKATRKNPKWRVDYMNYTDRIRIARKEQMAEDIRCFYAKGADIDFIAEALNVKKEWVLKVLNLQPSEENSSAPAAKQ